MTRAYWKTGTGHPVQAGAAVSRFPTDFLLGGHLGIVLEVYDERGVGIQTGLPAPMNRAVDGYTAQVLLVDDGRRAPYQVLEGVVVCAGAPLGAGSSVRIRPTPTSGRGLTQQQRDELQQAGRLPVDLPLEALDGDWCVLSYLGGNEQKPYISAFWPGPARTTTTSPAGPTSDAPLGAVLEARHAGLSVRVDARGSLVLSTEESGALPTVGQAVEADSGDLAAGPVVPTTGGDLELHLKPGRRIRILAGGEPLLSITHDGSTPVLQLGEQGDRPWQRLVLGDALVEFWNQFRADLVAKLQALEAQFERFYTQEYALHAHGLGPSGTTPPAQPVPNPAQATFQPATAAPPASPVQGAPPSEPARTPADRKTDDGTFATMKTYRLLSPAVRLPHPAARHDPNAAGED